MIKRLLNFLEHIFHIRDGKEQDEEIVRTIRDNVSFRGANLWALIFAIFIASIGLNINSTAIIIGAMLISPLMGPVVGFGLALGINDSDLLRRSVKNLSIATIIGISISTIYFFISPISNVQSELLARVNPTIYDVLIAFFGGLAGVVGSIRPGKNNVIPGVAIATALMPPLCTVGYGIATGQPQFFLGALYLYIINCIFICLATLLGIKYLKLPKVTYLDEKKSVRIRKYITAIVFIMIVPATYFGYVLVNENNFNQNTERYISDNFVDKGYTMIYKKVNYKSNPHRIEIALFSQNFTQQEVDNFKNLLQYYGLTNTELIIKQDTASLSEEEWKNTIANMKSESEKVKALEAKLTSNYFGSDTSNQILGEAQAINSKITKIAIGNLSLSSVESSENSTSTQDGNTLTVIIYTTEPLTSDEKNLLITWIKSRMNNQDAVVYFPS